MYFTEIINRCPQHQLFGQLFITMVSIPVNILSVGMKCEAAEPENISVCRCMANVQLLCIHELVLKCYPSPYVTLHDVIIQSFNMFLVDIFTTFVLV